MHKSSNIGLMWSAPSNHKFVALASNFVEPHIIPNDEEEEGQATEHTIQEVREDTVTTMEPDDADLPTTSEIQREQPVLIEFSDEGSQTESHPTSTPNKPHSESAIAG